MAPRTARRALCEAHLGGLQESESDEDSVGEGEEVREPSCPGEWKHLHLKRLLDCLVFFGPNHFHDIRAKAR